MTSPLPGQHRFEPLRQRAAGLEDQAAKLLAEALRRHAQAESRHAELCRYEAEYAERPLPETTGVNSLRHNAAFLARLREAVRFQAERVASSAQEVERARAHWLASHREVEKLDRLLAQAAQEARQKDARRQGREMDENAVRGFMARRLLVADRPA